MHFSFQQRRRRGRERNSEEERGKGGRYVAEAPQREDFRDAFGGRKRGGGGYNIIPLSLPLGRKERGGATKEECVFFSLSFAHSFHQDLPLLLLLPLYSSVDRMQSKRGPSPRAFVSNSLSTPSLQATNLGPGTVCLSPLPPSILISFLALLPPSVPSIASFSSSFAPQQSP